MEKIEILHGNMAVLSRLGRQLRDPNTDIAGITRLLQTDGALCANVIRVSNSFQYGTGQRTTHVHDALVKVGFNRILSLIGVALVEDTTTTRLILERLLQRNLTCEVASYASADELLSDTTSRLPDLFLLNVVLGDRSGSELCRELKARADTREIPVVFLSQHHQPQTRIEALRAGGVDYVDKPFYPEELLQRVRGCIERFQRQKELESQAQEQMALLCVLCHDLRNSVGASMSMLEQLADPHSADEHESCLDICQHATRSALDLIAHVGEYRSLLDENRMLKTETLNLRDTCSEAIKIIRPMAAAKQIALVLQCDPQLNLRINRVVLVHNVLVNLLTNAISFSRPASSVWVEAQASSEGADTGCSIIVCDEGIGIPSQILETLLKKRLVASRPGTSREQGSGIGMTLVQRYVERCGGTVAIESVTEDSAAPGVKVGTTVQLRFPQTTREPELIAG